MSWLDGARETVRGWLGRRAAERELAEELAFHREREVARRMARGAGRGEAERAARVSFGGEDRWREAMRDEWAGAFTGLGQDVRHGLRRLRRSPGFAAAAVLTLGLGIGANTAIFSLVRSVLAAPLPYPDPDELVMIWHPSPDDLTWLSQREVVEYPRWTESFASLGAYTMGNANLTEGEPERVRAAALTAELFGVLGLEAAQGRVFTVAEDEPGEDGVVVLAHGLWQRRYGGSRDVIGREIRVNGRARTVVGVLPAAAKLPLDYREERPTEVFLPAAIDETADLPWGDRSYFGVARLAPGVTAERASADLARAMRAWEEQGFVQEDDLLAVRRAVPVTELVLGDVRPVLFLLFGAVGILLLIACANVAHLQLARSDAQRREVATQAALGGSRLRLIRRLTIESALLAVAGALAGVAIGWLGLRAALALAPVNVIRMRGVELDAAVLGFTALLAIATLLLSGLAPAVRLSRVDLATAMAGARGDVAPLRRGTRRALVALETALAVMLAIGAVLLAKSFAAMRDIELGFDASSVLTARVELPRTDYPEPAQVEAFFLDLTRRIGELPGVDHAAAARVLPLTSVIGDWTITLESRAARPGENPNGDWQIVTPGYFDAMSIRASDGRLLDDRDGADAPLVAVVNETMARQLWPGSSAVGERFYLGTSNRPWIEVVGVSRPVRHNAVLEEERAEMYLPHAQFVRMKGGGGAQYGMSLVVRTSGPPLALVPAVREQLRALDPSLPLSEVRTMEDVEAAALAQPRFATSLFAVFAALALLLGAIGLYGLTSYTATRRTHELGVRHALGARPADLATLVVREGVGMAAIGIVVGLAGAAWLTSLLEAQLYGVARLDVATFVFVPAVLLAVAVAASWLPARRAARVSPLIALRAE